MGNIRNVIWRAIIPKDGDNLQPLSGYSMNYVYIKLREVRKQGFSRISRQEGQTGTFFYHYFLKVLVS